MKHSKEQQIAIDHVDGPMMVLAGPGAGKTTVITHRVKKDVYKRQLQSGSWRTGNLTAL